MGTSDEGQLDQRWVKALAHPLRIEILMVLADGEKSPNQIAETLGEKLGNVAYHVRKLAELDCIELADTRSVRGATEHFYKAKPRGFIGSTAWQKLPPKIRGTAASESLRSFVIKAVKAIEQETFERREGSRITWLPLTVDEEGWTEVAAILTDAEGLLQEVAQRSTKRLNTVNAIPVVIALAAFQSGPTGGEPSPS
jgi:DNA-binding transcriptional ArsR family regulator